jgi:tRNA dimethylallyltransferase
MDTKSKIILVSGPTASGKSEFAIKLAKKLKGEIINVDSMQIFKELRILNARPKKIDQKKIIHHLYGFLSVKRNFSAGEWLNLVKKKIKQIQNKKKLPILVGGTGLYFKALTDGLVQIPKIPLSFRNKIRNFQKKIGQENFYKKLVKLDPLVINVINSNDIQRSVRAYEVKKYTKVSFVKWFKETNRNFEDKELLKIYIECPRLDLIKRINMRVDKMFKNGAVNEVKKFLKLNVKKDKSSTKIIGINEIERYLKKEFDLKTAKELICIKTRQYAKRQSTWARGQMSNWQKIQYKDLDLFIKKFKLSSLKLDQ